jgi:hypothetical protein
VRKQFLDRPLDAATADCWARHVQSLRDAFRKHPDCAKKLTSEIRAAMDRWLHAIVSQGPETRQRFDDVRDRYAALWRQGKLDGPEMRKLIGAWCALGSGWSASTPAVMRPPKRSGTPNAGN